MAYANAIALAQAFVPVLDKIYKNASLTAVLDGNPDLVRAGANANELIIPKLAMQGLGDYSRNAGYVDGDVTLTNETVKCNFDRGRMFQVDNMDNLESAGIAFGQLSGEFIRTKVVPEEDAFRFAAYAGTPGVSKVAEGATLTTGADAVAAIRAGTSKMDEDEVATETRYLFITPTLHGLIEDMDTNKSREVLKGFAGVIKVPQTRFYTAIEQLSGTGADAAGGYRKYSTHYRKVDADTAGALKVVADAATPSSGEIKLSSVTPCVDGYTPAVNDYVVAETGKDINFMIVEKSAVIQFPKHVAPKIITPDVNQNADAYKFGYRKVSIADVYENKLAGIYLHHKA